MFFQLLLWSNILICPVAVCILLFRRAYPVATIFFILALTFITGLSYIDLQSLQHPGQLLVLRKYGFFFEVAAVLSCYFYTKTIFRDNSEIYKGPGFWMAAVIAAGLLGYVIVCPIEKIIFSPDFAQEHILFVTKRGFAVYLLLMVFLVFGLVQLERTYNGLHQLQRWSIKLEIIGSGLLLAGFALYFSQNLLYRSLDMDYLGLRSAAAFIALSLFCYSRLFRGENTGLALSRGIAHRSFVLLIVGGYLILLGIIGEGMRYFNVVDVQLLFSVLLLFGSLGLAGIFLSEKLRRKIKVVLHKNFYQSKYDYREQWEQFAKSVAAGTTLTEIQIAILDLFCETLACKGAGFYLHDPETNTFHPTATFNFRRDWRPFSAHDPLLAKLQRRDWIINLTETDPELAGSLIESFAEIGAFLVVPLFFDDDLVGFIVIGEQINQGEELTFEDYDLLRMLARQASSTVQGLRLSEQLSVTRELAAIGKVSTFVLHDLKNQVSGLSLMLDNAREYIEDPVFQQDMLETVSNTVENMKGLIARLKNLKEKPQLIIASTDLKKIVDDAVQTSGGSIVTKGQSLKIVADEEEIYKVILNLLMNALEASDGQGSVQVEYGCRENKAFLTVADQGCGMNDDFVKTKLFKPFATTKKHGFGIGLYQCKQIMESHQGSIFVDSKEGKGTKFTLLLPRAPEA